MRIRRDIALWVKKKKTCCCWVIVDGGWVFGWLSKLPCSSSPPSYSGQYFWPEFCSTSWWPAYQLTFSDMPADPGPPADLGLGPPIDYGPSTSGNSLKWFPPTCEWQGDHLVIFVYCFAYYTNPNKKKDNIFLLVIVVRMWHGVSEVFYSLSALKLQLMDSFPEEVPSNIDFQVGYFEGKSHAKH